MSRNYTDEEIQETLHEMGFQLPEQSLFNDLRQDVNNHNPNAHEITSENLTDYFNILQLPALPERFRHQPWGNVTMNQAERVLQNASKTLLLAADHMANLEKQVGDFLFGRSSSVSRFVEIDDQMVPEIPVSLTPYRDQDDSPPVIEENKENQEELPRPMTIVRRPPQKRFAPPNPADERRKINQMLKEKCLMRVHPEPGRMPFRVDRVALIKWYESEWTKHPRPGEAKRLNLRRKIREWMLRRDIPIIKLQNQQAGETTRPEWID